MLSEESGDKTNQQYAEIIKAKVLMAQGDMHAAEFLLDKLGEELKSNPPKSAI